MPFEGKNKNKKHYLLGATYIYYSQYCPSTASKHGLAHYTHDLKWKTVNVLNSNSLSVSIYQIKQPLFKRNGTAEGKNTGCEQKRPFGEDWEMTLFPLCRTKLHFTEQTVSWATSTLQSPDTRAKSLSVLHMPPAEIRSPWQKAREKCVPQIQTRQTVKRIVWAF